MSRRTRILSTLGAGLLLFLTLGAWSLASPVGAAPDDDFHLASIWCGSGERDGLCEPGSSDRTRRVPEKIVFAVCYAYSETTTAACQGDHYLDPGFTLVETDRLNTGNQYPSGFYFWASLLAGDNLAVSTIAIRLLGSALFSILTVGTWWLLPARLRFTLAGSIALTFVPVGAFFLASVNPSSWAFTSAALLVPALLGYFQASGWRRAALGGVAALAVLLGIGSRGDSAAYAVVGILAALVLSFRASPRFVALATLPAALLVAGVLAFFGAGQTGLALGGDMAGEAGPENPTSKPALALLNLLSLPRLYEGVFGAGWGLGWLDTMLPAIVSGIGVFLCAGVLFASLARLSWRRAVALAGVTAAAVVVPTVILVQSGAVVGQEVQPRYVLPLLTMLLAAAVAPEAVTADGERAVGSTLPATGRAARLASWLREPSGALRGGLVLSPLQLWIIAGGIAVANATALLWNLKRYVTGGSIDLLGAAEWWWAAGPAPVAVLGVGALAGAGLMTLWASGTSRAMRAERQLSP